MERHKRSKVLSTSGVAPSPASGAVVGSQFAKKFTLAPDLQVVFNPAKNPDKSSIWTIGVRVILTL